MKQLADLVITSLEHTQNRFASCQKDSKFISSPSMNARIELVERWWFNVVLSIGFVT